MLVGMLMYFDVALHCPDIKALQQSVRSAEVRPSVGNQVPLLLAAAYVFPAGSHAHIESAHSRSQTVPCNRAASPEMEALAYAGVQAACCALI